MTPLTHAALETASDAAIIRLARWFGVSGEMLSDIPHLRRVLDLLLHDDMACAFADRRRERMGIPRPE